MKEIAMKIFEFVKDVIIWVSIVLLSLVSIGVLGAFFLLALAFALIALAICMPFVAIYMIFALIILIFTSKIEVKKVSNE